MNCASDVKFDELGNDIDTENFNGAQCKAICVEAGMIALSRNSNVATHEIHNIMILTLILNLIF